MLSEGASTTSRSPLPSMSARATPTSEAQLVSIVRDTQLVGLCCSIQKPLWATSRSPSPSRSPTAVPSPGPAGIEIRVQMFGGPWRQNEVSLPFFLRETTSRSPSGSMSPSSTSWWLAPPAPIRCSVQVAVRGSRPGRGFSYHCRPLPLGITRSRSPSPSTSPACMSVVHEPLARMVCFVQVGYSYQNIPSPFELAATASSRPSPSMSPRVLQCGLVGLVGSMTTFWKVSSAAAGKGAASATRIRR